MFCTVYSFETKAPTQATTIAKIQSTVTKNSTVDQPAEIAEAEDKNTYVIVGELMYTSGHFHYYFHMRIHFHIRSLGDHEPRFWL